MGQARRGSQPSSIQPVILVSLVIHSGKSIIGIQARLEPILSLTDSGKCSTYCRAGHGADTAEEN